MLKKLERHGLAIDDMNNESLREECLKSVNSTYKAKSTKAEIQTTILTTENTLNTEINPKQTQFGADELNKTMLQTFLKYFIDLQKPQNKTNKKHAEERTKSVVFETYNIPQSSNLKYIFSDTVGYNSPPLKKNDKQTPTTEGAFHLFSQNILRLWNTYNKQDIKEITSSSEPITFQPITTTTAIPVEKNSNDHAKEMQYMKKLFEDYFSKNQISITTSLPPTTEINVNKISEVIRRFLADTKTENNDKNAHLAENATNKQLNDARIGEERKHISSYNEPNVEHGTKPPYDSKKIRNESIGSLIVDNKLFEDDNHINTVNNLYANMQKGNNMKNERKKSLPNDLIKELAESVKELVLRDLKKEISTIIPKPITEKSSPVTPKVENEKTSEASGVMDKIMELVQQIKSIKEKTIIAGNSKIKVTEKTDIHHEYKGPANVLYSYKPVISSYGVKSPADIIAPIFVKQYNHEPNINVPKYNEAPIVQNPTYQVDQIDNNNAKTGLRLAPITIQTNNFEVPPLNIPIFKPLGMVNQNIIVTTESPNRRPRLDTHHTNFIHHIDRYKVEDDFRTRNGWRKPTPSSERWHNSNNRYDYDTPKVGKHNNGYKRDYYKPHFTKSDYNRMKLRNQENKRFHERLENIDEPRSAEDRGDCCKLKVASRQQLPLSAAKKQSRFDDIHFRNFLQTQQKVNDMLEKILATKAKSDGPRSVETT